MRFRSLAAAVLSLGAAAALLSCTSSGDGGTGATGEYLDRGAAITPVAPTALEYVDITKVSGDRDSVCVAVTAHRAFSVYAVAFTLSYDASKLRYVSYDDTANCIGSGTAVLPAQVDASQPGQIIVGMSRNIATTSTAVDCGLLMQVCFDVIGTGDTTMAFTGNRQFLGPPPTGAPVTVEWTASDVHTQL